MQIRFTTIGASRGLFESNEEEPLGRASTFRPYKGAISAHIDVPNVRGGMYDRTHGGDLFVTVRTIEGRYPLTNLCVAVDAHFPDGSRKRIPMSDNGIWPDAVASDGIFTGILRIGHAPEGQVVLTASVSNPDGTVTPTWFMNSTRRIGDFDLDGDSPFFGEPITERFYRLAQTAFDIRGTVPADARPLPDFETVTLPLVNLGEISGLMHLVPGIEIEYSIDVYPYEMTETLAERFAWSGSSNLIITPDPQGRLNVVRVRVDSFTSGVFSETLQFGFNAPNAMRGLMEDQTRTRNLRIVEPAFQQLAVNPTTILEGEEAFFNMRLVLSEGYDSSASWSMTTDPNNAGEIVNQRADGVTFRTLRPGRFTMTLSSDVWPELINRSVEIHSIFRELPGTPGDNAFRPGPIPANPDPGGDGDVRTRPGGGGNNREPEYQAPKTL